jgi:hypothetical protein
MEMQVTKIEKGYPEKRLEIAVETRQLEINLFWQRSLFFWGFIAAAFVGYSTSYNQNNPEIALVIGCYGFVTSIAWTLANRGSKYWQESWEQKVEREEGAVLGQVFFAQREPIQRKNKGPWLQARTFSVSRLTIALSDFTCGIWVLLVLWTVLIPAAPNDAMWDWIKVVLPLLTLVFSVLMSWQGHSGKH